VTRLSINLTTTRQQGEAVDGLRDATFHFMSILFSLLCFCLCIFIVGWDMFGEQCMKLMGVTKQSSTRYSIYQVSHYRYCHCHSFILSINLGLWLWPWFYLELGIRAKVRGPVRLTHSFDGIKSNFFGPFIFLSVWVGPLKPWVMRVKSAGSWVWPVTRFILFFIYIINYKFYLFGCIT
jgi:hypothetical protein